MCISLACQCGCVLLHALSVTVTLISYSKHFLVEG